MPLVLMSDLVRKVKVRVRLDPSQVIQSSETSFADADFMDFINEGNADYYQKLLDAGDTYYNKPVKLTVASNQSVITLPADFARFRSLDKMTSGDSPDGYVSLTYFTTAERNDRRGAYNRWSYSPVPRYRLQPSTIELVPENLAPGDYRLYYAPDYVPKTSLSDTFNFSLEWQTYVVAYAALQVLIILNQPSDEMRIEVERQAARIVRGKNMRGAAHRMQNVRGR